MEGSTAISGDVSSTGVTSFANEACEAVMVNQKYVPSSLVIAQPDLQDIKGYFARPRLAIRGSLTYGTRSRFASYITTTSDLATIFPQWANRLSGAFGIRYTLNYRLQVAATPFHQGLLAMSYQYACPGTSTSLYYRAGLSASATNCPHVRMDLSETTMVELSVPFLYAQEYALVDVANTDTYGIMSINNILPSVSVTGLAAPTYELYMYLTDIELFGADNNAPTTITLQSGLSTFGKEAKEARLLSSGLDGIAKASNFVARNIPSLASFAGPVAWVAGTASGIAKYLGFSRPLLQDAVVRTVRGPYISESNVDVPMAGFSCGLMQSNTLEISPEVGASNIDEMALAYITSQWSQCLVGSVATSNTHNQVVYAAPVSPSVFWFRAPASAPYCNVSFPKNNIAGATYNSVLPTSLMNIASYFRFWRGDFKFRITFSKTKFHGGRYMISYNPSFAGRADNNNPFTTIDGPERVSSLVQPYGYSKIMDLRDGNVFEFDVPYMSPEPYVPFCSSIGGLSIVCMDPLQDNPSVCSSVPFLVEVCGSDFELADFAGPWFAPFPSGTILQQSGDVVRSSRISLQSGEVVMDATVINPSKITVGEKIMSAKQLIQSPSWSLQTMTTGTNKNCVYPWFYSKTVSYLDSIKATPLPVSLQLTGNTTASAIAKLYAFVRGGTDHHIYPPGVSGITMVHDQAPYDTYWEYGSGNKDSAVRQGSGSTPKVVAINDAPLHVRSPAFNNRVRIPTHSLDALALPVIGITVGVNGFGVRGHVDRVTLVNNTATSQVYWYAKAASDDATLAHYIGPVPVAIYNGATTGFPESDWYK